MLEYLVTVDLNFTSQTVAVFDNDEKFITKADFSKMGELIKNYKFNTNNTFGIVSAVSDSNLKDIPFKNQLARRLLLHGKFLEMPVKYSEKIQDERLVNAYFAFKQNTQSKVVINCGHIMTADFVDSSGFKGGYILPSLGQLRNLYKFDEYFKHSYNEAGMSLDYTGQIPVDNQQAIEQGTLAGFLFQIKGLIKQHKPEIIYITGPHGETVAKFLKATAQKENMSIQLSKELIHRSLCFIAKRVHR